MKHFGYKTIVLNRYGCIPRRDDLDLEIFASPFIAKAGLLLMELIKKKKKVNFGTYSDQKKSPLENAGYNTC